MTDITTTAPSGQVFTFGDPEPVLDQREILGMLYSYWNGTYYEPPVSFYGMAKMLHATPVHQSAIMNKVNFLTSHFVPHKLLSRKDFKRLALDHQIFGNAFLEETRNRLGGRLGLKPLLARWTRVGKGDFVIDQDCQLTKIPADRVCHVLEPDITQEVYGLPSYLSAIQSSLLNEAATLFRRKYYTNGSHAGYILYLTGTNHSTDMVDGIRQAMRDGKGPGNFKNMLIHTPNGDKEGVKVLPISEVTARDEFLNIKNVSRDDVMAVHRTPPQLLGLIPQNAGGFGDVTKAAEIFFHHEIRPLMTVFDQVNDWAGDEVVKFKDYEPLKS